mmetsp:Transcript_21121/g.44588  ORF Transcript_21121/g.44588 Transcript_21121/m.44588 type:complete len:95 (+) Transcript_21121:199-483(+)
MVRPSVWMLEPGWPEPPLLQKTRLYVLPSSMRMVGPGVRHSLPSCIMVQGGTNNVRGGGGGGMSGQRQRWQRASQTEKGHDETKDETHQRIRKR